MNKNNNNLINNILCNSNDTIKLHYGGKQNKLPSKIHTDVKKRYVVKFNTKNIIKYKTRYIKISQNQLQILDALLNNGGNKTYLDSKHKLRYSEHSGILDFDKTKLERIMISGRTTREDEDDVDILLPHDMKDVLDYEYIFHTHPPTPYVGARAKQGILYEFPSISDLYHFSYHYNAGHIQGSIIIAPEGIYIIRMKKDVKYIEYPSEETFDKLESLNLDIQRYAIKKYGDNFKNNEQLFYNSVCQDSKYIKLFNKIVKKHFNKNMQILFKPRTFDKNTNKWIIKNLYIKVAPIEINYE